MQTKLKSSPRAACLLFGGAVLLLASNVQAQNLFVAGNNSGNIYEFTPGGVQSIFASGLSGPTGLAFDSAGDLFVTENNIFTGDGSIVEITPDGVQSTFASGLGILYGLAFQPAPEPSVFGLLAVSAIALLVCRRQNLLRG